MCAVQVYLCVCMCVFLRGLCMRDQEKVNYLPVLRCRLASPGWAGSSKKRERSIRMERKGEKEEKGNPRLAQNDRTTATICEVRRE